MSKNLIIFLMFPLVLNGQIIENRIHGFIYDKDTGEPIELVNVYLSNTTIGASTDVDGRYVIRSVPPGTHEMVITIVGYKYVSKTILVKKDSNLRFNFQLRPLIYETESTEVIADIPQEWLDNLEIFKRFFLGRSGNQNECKILNPEILDFTFPRSGLFIAKASAPLEIKNEALGYKVYCVLVDFFWDKRKHLWSWSVKPRFASLEDSDPDLAARWPKNRAESYFGSVYHFLHSFTRKRLKEEGFDLYFVSQSGERVSRLDWRATIVDYDELLFPGITANETNLKFKGFLHVVYQKTEESWIRLNYKEIAIDEYGYPQENNPYEVYGHWAEKGVADLLPKYYTPPKNSE